MVPVKIYITACEFSDERGTKRQTFRTKSYVYRVRFVPSEKAATFFNTCGIPLIYQWFKISLEGPIMS